MIRKIILRTTIVCCFAVVAFVFIQSLTRSQGLIQVLFSTITSSHVQPKKIDDAYSKQVYDEYLKTIDPKKQFFIKSDIDRIAVYKLLIDDELNEGTFVFYDMTNDILTKRMTQVNKFLPSLFETPLKFDSKELLELDAKNRDYAKSEQELKAYWKQVVCVQVMSEYLSLFESKSSSENASYKNKYSPELGKVDPELEKKARLKVKESLTSMFKRRLEEKEQDKKAYYFDTLMNVFDAHSGYFPPEKKEDFDISISGKLEGIGAVLTEKDGMIRVEKIIPGGAAWKQGELVAEDRVLKVAQGAGEPVEITGMRVQDAVKHIRGKKGTEVRLTVKKPSGKVIVISLIRDVVLIEETYAKAVVIENKTLNKRIGYIYLPKFYRDFSDNKGRNTTDDIRKLLKQLKDSNVDGVIFDMRNNEGGALEDAVNTTGLFISKGPVVQVKSKTGAPKIYFDKDESVTYSGPLVILVNTYSASAAEIVAAALQDYKRAVVVGSTRTFGKGTVQSFFDLDALYPDYAQAFEGMGSIKVTIQKFYRISGKTTQSNGVVSDVVLPDGNSALDIGEKYLDFSLPFDTIAPIQYTVWDNPENIGKLKEASQKRVEKSTRFNALRMHYDAIKRENKMTKTPLDLKQAYARRKRIDLEGKVYNDKQKPFKDLIFNRPVGASEPTDKVLQATEKDFRDNLAKDLLLYESMFVLRDMIAK